jgi:hypothetical protein
MRTLVVACFALGLALVAAADRAEAAPVSIRADGWVTFGFGGGCGCGPSYCAPAPTYYYAAPAYTCAPTYYYPTVYPAYGYGRAWWGPSWSVGFGYYGGGHHHHHHGYSRSYHRGRRR